MIISKILFTFSFYIVFTFCSIIDAIISIPLYIINPSGKIIHFFLYLSSKIILFFTNIKVKVDYRFQPDKNSNYLIISNHQSLFDILVIFSTLKNLQYKWIIKKSLFYIPFFGFPLLYLAGYIKLDRKNRYKAYKSIMKSIDILNKGFSIVIFPEGTRSREDKIQKFKAGSIKIAIRANVEILPVVLYGTLFVKRKGSFLINPSSIKVRVLQPVSLKNFANSEKEALLYLENLIRKHYNDLKTINQ